MEPCAAINGAENNKVEALLLNHCRDAERQKERRGRVCERKGRAFTAGCNGGFGEDKPRRHGLRTVELAEALTREFQGFDLLRETEANQVVAILGARKEA